eukprot:TRINITY_DN856_c1_g1_i1.p1 TRINITY_DN856_c1_g1~~TRINITY_DN856_c1_g1_i1.p1  ORF type:complete len:106 (-),score=25.57 TRINITY_DN856_c1_g1_i1:48-335(-)
MADEQPIISKETLTEIFNGVDTDGNGQISREEVSELVNALCANYDVSEENKLEISNVLISLADTDGDNQISLQEFLDNGESFLLFIGIVFGEEEE